jgi:hypothetical protein
MTLDAPALTLEAPTQAQGPEVFRIAARTDLSQLRIGVSQRIAAVALTSDPLSRFDDTLISKDRLFSGFLTISDAGTRSHLRAARAVGGRLGGLVCLHCL